MRNVASNHRRGATAAGPGRRAGHPTPLAPCPLEHAQNLEAAAFVQTFLAGLDERKRAVFVLGALEEMSMPEVAAALSIPLNTAYTRLRSVRADFERALGSRKS